MKACPKCGKLGRLTSHEAIMAGETTYQILDYKLECAEHGEYAGSFTPDIVPDRERVKSPLVDCGDMWKEPEPQLELEPVVPELEENTHVD